MKLYQHSDSPTTFVVIGSDIKRRQILDWVISNFSSVKVKPKDFVNSTPSVSDMFFTSEEDAILLKMQCEILYFKRGNNG